jgi:hypothetical protein
VEEITLDAPGQDGDAPARLAARRHVFRQGGLLRHALQERVHRRQPRQTSQQSRRADGALHAPAPVTPRQPERGAETRGTRKYRKEQIGQPPLPHPSPALREIRARRLEQGAELHAGRASRLAGAAAEAKIEVTLIGLGRLEPPLGDGAHEIEAAARRVHLLTEHAVGRALRQADAAVHAGAQHGRGAGLGECRGRCRGSAGAIGHHRPATKRPGFKVRSGSNSCLSARMR